MCDYSLEAYRRRPAQTGEKYRTHRFPTGSIGLIAEEDPTTAVCVECDTRLRLAGLSESVRTALNVAADEDVTFVRLDGGGYRDGVEFASGRRVSLQQIGPGVTAYVTKPLSSSIWATRQVELA